MYMIEIFLGISILYLVMGLLPIDLSYINTINNYLNLEQINKQDLFFASKVFLLYERVYLFNKNG